MVRRGEPGSDAFWLESGTLDVVSDSGTVLGQIHEGSLVGEYAALVGGERTASIRASGPATVRVITPDDLDALLTSNPALAVSIRDEAARRVQHTRVVEALTGLVGADHAEAVRALADRGSWRVLTGGESLFVEGDPADSAFVVVSGRLHRQPTERDCGGYLAAGSMVGEEGLAGGRRRATLEAVRDTVVLEIGRTDFAELATSHPQAFVPVALGLAAGVHPPQHRHDRTIAVAVTAALNSRQVTSRIAEQLGRLGSVEHLWSARVDARLDRPGIASSAPGTPGEIRLLEYLARAESEHRYLVVEPDRDDTVWSSRVLTQADVVAVVATADPDDAEQDRIRAVIGAAGSRALRVLVLVHPENAERPSGTAAVLERHAVDHVLHTRAGSVRDVARVARSLAGRPVALVLGGGGARGFASIGVYRAMYRLGIPVDVVGATSIGAPLGAGMALDLAPDEIQAESQRLFHGVLDYTVPIVSLLKGERAASAIRDRFEGWSIEDLWRPFFAISTNLTQGGMHVHRTGDVPTALRASVAIPGAFPPVPLGDDLLVDGGVTNNLPVDVMRRLHPTATVVAVSVAPAQGPRAKSDYGLSVSGWQAMKSKVGKGPRYPGIVAVLMRSMITGSLDKSDAVIANGAADLLLDLDLRGVGLLEFERVADVADRGYELAMPRLEAWLETVSHEEGDAGVVADRP